MKSSFERSFILRTTGIAAGAFLVFASQSALAGPTEIGAGVMGIVGGNFLDKPDRTILEPDIYPGFGGLTAGLGLMFDLRFIKLIGLEADVIRSSDKGSGTDTINGQHLKMTIGQGAWHVPVLAKLTIPSPLIAPQFFVGPEFVFPSKGDVSTDPSTNFLRETAGNYVAITGGLGLEIKLPLPVLDLRIPIGLRGSYTPSVSSKFADRYNVTTFTLHSEWKFAANFTAGAALYF
jgi:hypothetical protein